MLVNVARRWFARHAKVAKIASGDRYRPRLEALEDRCVPSW
jgi:hypothetical protein